ncbi:YfbM family protein [Ferruginibacter sp. SUN106]|uniref:YfbM family protein n=1 Tax=Ferruginibacter sp. SUN106 TaxID=2978348 RepID=UPI003D360C5E
MIGNLLRVTKTDLEAYLKDSSLLESSIYDEETDDENPNLTDIDKSWDGILFLLTGQNVANTDHPLAKVLFSGQIIDEEQDLGYGPAHYLTPEQVADLNDQLSKITTAELKQKYDPEKMEAIEVYPSIWTEEGDGAFEYLSEYFKTVQEVYSEAAKNGEAIITFIN